MESRQAAAPAWILLTALCLGSPEPGDSKVYYSCGAVMDSLERGLVLSPGFPNRYHRGAHCVWQFIIPVGTQLVMEMLDFDVFESTGEEEPSGLHVKWMSQETTFKDEGETSSPSATSETSFQDVTPPPDPASKPSVLGDPRRGSSGDARMKDASRQMVGEGQLSVMDLAVAAQSRLESTLQAIYHPRRRPENSGQATAKDVGGRSKFAQGTDGRQDKAQGDDDKYLHPQLELTDSTTLSATPWVMDTSPTLLPWADICPQDVLYISDLITFSSRFCGANSPLNKTLVFGSPSEMVEVIMEFITITNRGRGFLMLFEYRNTSGTAAVHVQGHGAAGNLMALAVINGAVFFGVALLATLCLVYRKEAPKVDLEGVKMPRELWTFGGPEIVELVQGSLASSTWDRYEVVLRGYLQFLGESGWGSHTIADDSWKAYMGYLRRGGQGVGMAKGAAAVAGPHKGFPGLQGDHMMGQIEWPEAGQKGAHFSKPSEGNAGDVVQSV